MASLKTIFKLSNKGTCFENITINPRDGTLLVTRTDCPEVWRVDPVTGEGSCLVTIPDVASVTGICRLTDRAFALGAGNFDPTTGPEAGSWSIWILELFPNNEQPGLRKVAAIPPIGFINGIATWDANTVLATDCANGKVYSVDISKRDTFEVALEDETMTVPAGAPLPIGINGIKVHRTPSQTFVYYTTTMRMSLYRVPVSAELKAIGPVETLHSGSIVDDFIVLESSGTIYLCTHNENVVITISPDHQESKTVAGHKKKLDLAGCTACVLGQDGKRLYVCTNGGNSEPVDGITEPASIVELNLA
ncbi:unnamed protein product [Clonostachys byssicola]|uniref:SMP-30/Gluconolactonase/LRE-like region domain-containing protein n=1 Tax=Clonostachys byssicola TaxID=160290 RepID=A0A9N9UTR9_9HYPO|nr:unnamed protein product [Clonostachys byssicola]